MSFYALYGVVVEIINGYPVKIDRSLLANAKAANNAECIQSTVHTSLFVPNERVTNTQHIYCPHCPSSRMQTMPAEALGRQN